MADADFDPAAKRFEEQTDRACSLVGEIVLITSAVDNQLNKICILTLYLTASPLLEAVVASIDCGRKIEILKAYAHTVKALDWKKAILKHAEAVEKINGIRNIAAHSLLSLEDGDAVLVGVTAAKLLKSLSLSNKKPDKTKLNVIEDGIRKAQAALHSGEDLLNNLERLNEERYKRQVERKIKTRS